MSWFAKATRELLAAARRAKLSGREYDVLMTAIGLRHGKWWIRRCDLEHETGLDERNCRFVLAAIQRKGVARIKRRGNRHDPAGWLLIETRIESDPGSRIESDPGSRRESDRIRSDSTFYSEDHKSEPVPPADARLRARAREADGRAGDFLDERLGPLEGLCRELYPDVQYPAHFLRRLLELAPHASVERLTAYLRFEASSSDAKWKLGAACKEARWEAWQRRTRRSRVSGTPAPVESGERVSAADIEAFARRR